MGINKKSPKPQLRFETLPSSQPTNSRKAGLLALDHPLAEPSHRTKATVASLNQSPRHSGGTAPDSHRTSLFSLTGTLLVYLRCF